MNNVIELSGRIYERADFLKLRLGLSAVTIYRWTRKGLLPQPIRLGVVNYYRKDLVEDLLSQGQQT